MKKIIEKIPENKANLVAIILCTVFIIGVSAYGSIITSIPTYDLSSVEKEANLMLENEGKFSGDGYFSTYSNQVPLTILIFFIYKVGSFFNISNLKIFATIVNAIFMAITAFFVYLSIKKVENYKLALITLLFYVINPIFYVYASYYYSDTLCMPFSAISIYMYILLIKSESNIKKIILGICSGIIFMIGFKVRVVIGIYLIALFITMIFFSIDKKKLIINIISIIMGIVLGSGITALIENSTSPNIKDNLKYPVTHWIMMGMNSESNGRYTPDDYVYTHNFETYSEKVENNILKIKERIINMGPSGFLTFMKNKTAVTWSNGCCDYENKFINVENINKIYEYISGNKKIFLVYAIQIWKVSMMIVLLFAIIRENKSNSKKYCTTFIALFGAVLFYLIWEAKDRYSLSFTPWIMLIFGYGMEEIEEFLKLKSIKLEKNNDININVQEILKNVARVLFICSIFLLIINYHEYAVKEKLKWDKAAIQYYSNNKVKISNKKIVQTFKASKKFNCMAIKFINNNMSEETNYTLLLKDNKEKILYKKDFKNKEVADDTYKIFKFNYIKPKGEKLYKIEIFSSDATDNNTIEIATFYMEHYSAYTKGDMLIDGKKQEADFNFKIVDENYRPYVSKKFYITLSIAIIVLEIFAFYPYLKKKNNKEG